MGWKIQKGILPSVGAEWETIDFGMPSDPRVEISYCCCNGTVSLLLGSCIQSRHSPTCSTSKNTGTGNSRTLEHHETFRNTQKKRNTPIKLGTLPRKPGSTTCHVHQLMCLDIIFLFSCPAICTTCIKKQKQKS